MCSESDLGLFHVGAVMAAKDAMMGLRSENTKNLREGCASRDRMRRHRERRQRGVQALVQIEVTEPLVCELIAQGWIETHDDDGKVRVTRKGIGAALSAMLADWAEG